MYPSNTLNHRPRGFSAHATPEEQSILPQFLRQLSASAPSKGDSYDHAEKRMDGNNMFYANANGHRRPRSFAGFGAGVRGRVFKNVGIILLFLMAIYFFLPWAPSVARFGAFFME
jgi:hypothetical protein